MLYSQNVLLIMFFFPECATKHDFFQNMLPIMFFPRMCCQSCFFPECAANHVFFPECAVNHGFFPECVDNLEHILGKNMTGSTFWEKS
jgi:hypothetical protein